MASKPGSADTARSIRRVARLDEIEQMILDGMDGREIKIKVRANPDKWPGEDGAPLTSRQIERDVREVWLRLRKRHEEEREHLITKAIVKWERRERLADAAKDYKSGNVALANWTRIHGLYAPTRAEVEVKGAVQVNVNVQVRALVNVLSERGLAALRVLHEEIEAARAAGKLLPAAGVRAGGRGDEDEPSEDDEPASVPSSGSVN